MAVQRDHDVSRVVVRLAIQCIDTRRRHVRLAHLPSSVIVPHLRHNTGMQDNNNFHDDEKKELPPELLRHLALCKRAYERMRREGTWPWADSPEFGDVVKSDDNPTTS